MADTHNRVGRCEDEERRGRTPVLARIMVGVAALLFLAPAPAYAYIDPGTGAFLWQIVLVFFLGLFFRFRHLASRLVGLLRFWRRR